MIPFPEAKKKNTKAKCVWQLQPNTPLPTLKELPYTLVLIVDGMATIIPQDQRSYEGLNRGYVDTIPSGHLGVGVYRTMSDQYQLCMVHYAEY